MSRQFYINFIQDEVSEMTADDKVEVLRLCYRAHPEHVHETLTSSYIDLNAIGTDLLREVFMMLCSRHNLDPEVLLN